MKALTNVAALVAAGLLGGGIAVAAVGTGDKAGGTTTVVASAPDGQPVAEGLDVGQIYSRAIRGVVEISVQGSQATPGFGPFGDGQRRSQGSGFVLDDEGHVVTNAHVVQGASSVTVTLRDGSEHTARVLGTDPSTDLAVLKVDVSAEALHPLELADSSQVEVGDGVLALGSPFGLEGTATTGIISAVGREITAPNGYAIGGALQTDAAVNSGSSGGPLLDAAGRVIGVNTQIESESGGNDGVGFAVPSDTVRSVARQLIASGRVEHAYLGVSLEDAANRPGASITTVRSGSPAARAGLEAGDRVTALDGEAVESAGELRRLVDDHEPGDEVTLTVVRDDGDERELSVELGTRPE
jgi:putative serine protease PepD